MRLIKKLTRKIDLYKIRDYQGIDGWLTTNEAHALYRLALKVPRGGTVVEIGCWKGKSTYCIAKGIQNAKYFTIDPFDASGEKGDLSGFYSEN